MKEQTDGWFGGRRRLNLIGLENGLNKKVQLKANKI